MKSASGTTIDTERNKFFKSMGSSVRPAYPGFSVMNTAAVNVKGIFASSKLTDETFLRIEFWI